MTKKWELTDLRKKLKLCREECRRLRAEKAAHTARIAQLEAQCSEMPTEYPPESP